MLKIRLMRIGRRHRPYYRIVVTDSRRKRSSGKYTAVLGTYDPLASKGQKINVDKRALEEWIRNGAQMSEAVWELLASVEEKKAKWPDKPAQKQEAEEEGTEDANEGDETNKTASAEKQGEENAEGSAESSDA